LGAVLSTLARHDAALAVLEWVTERYRASGDLEGEGRVAAQIGQLHVEMGTPEQGILLIQPLVARLVARGPSPALGALYMALTQIFYFTGRYSEEVEAAEQAAAVASALGDTRLLASAHGARGTALETMGRIQEGLEALQEALRLAESTGQLGSPSDIDMLIHATWPSFYSGQFAAGLRYIERAVRASERLGDPLHLAWSLTHRGPAHIYTGDWEGARRDLERAVTMHRQLGISSRSAWALTFLGYLHHLEGAWEEATRELEEASSTAEQGGDRLILLLSQGELAEIEIRQGQATAACTRLLPLLDHHDMRRQQLHAVLPRLAWARLELGETSEAEALVTQIVGYAREAGELLLLARESWLQALVATRQGRSEDAAAAIEEGLSLARSMPYPYAEARTLQVNGLMHRRRGEAHQAREKLEAALAIFRRLGARRDIEQTGQLLTTLG
jgi:tetratricopeptide (TPR) repeat protein